ncbi:MAG: type II toxin-antitoxin system HicB family antitoxin [Chloroflexota bacterium]|nr:type II toxin-antitoxin system HicB family antitoxin [Chloroflexota bacterium]
MKRRFSVVLTPEPDGSAINVTSPDVPELITFGHTREEALAMARECAEGLILTFLDHGDELPDEGGRAEVATIDVDLDALRRELAAEKASKVGVTA